ncbi:hypothetical protein VPH35_047413 [Triticum aestivum]|uniref:F-box domain-containing protein n=2 Tax=Triticum TaxID=4564 RepID=A0A9R0RXF3_TRITD|nr:F-box protein At5g49610-like [Triticum aestivum]XP_044343003.1 F-box protein At5g49610-like [Triticum aestivum]XP_044343004.1 F-box protein At5g49610-like [Triticum aestivum]XP_044343005.1 F-box protein At5g49610-like [Triticum aestivum]VAH68647.1 unnamed protein product [Triticum turgidum subsp. durum]
MAKAATAAAAAPLHSGLPDEIAIWEILVRLPPKSLLRCRAVCRAWRSATSARDFLLAHHARQPALPLACGLEDDGGSCYYLAAQHQPVARLAKAFYLCASCDGLLLLSKRNQLSICNPATRQYAPLPASSAFIPLGMYRHRPTGEYRILLYKEIGLPATDGQDACHIFALGSVQPPRSIGSLQEAEQLRFSGVPVPFRGNLHWHLNKHWYLQKYWYLPENHESRSNIIIVFDTTAERFREMCAPVVPDHHKLFEMDGMLGMSSFNNTWPIIDVWMMQEQDYESEVWTLKYRVELSNADLLLVQFGQFVDYWNVVVASCDGAVLVLVKFGKSILQFDIDGKLVSFHHKDLLVTQHRLKQTLVPHTFFPRLDGHSVNAWPFI